jgi:predicted ester cyclase
MTISDNIEIVRRAFEEGMNGRDRAVLDELVAPGYVNHAGTYLPPSPAGPQNWTDVHTRLEKAFPDVSWRVLRSLAEGDQVWNETTMSGTHEGVFLGHPPTGLRFEVRQVHMLRISGGQIHEHWAVRDDLGILTQLGLVPVPAWGASGR